MASQLLTPKDVADALQISVEAVYKHKRRLCGFYPAGIKVLRFREDVINDIIQGQAAQFVEVRVPKEREKAYGKWFPDKDGSKSRNGTAQKRNVRRKDPNRHGL